MESVIERDKLREESERERVIERRESEFVCEREKRVRDRKE